MIITIDGPSAAGKGTVARIVSKDLSIPHIDTGMIYRAVAYVMSGFYTDPVMERMTECTYDMIKRLVKDIEYSHEVIGGYMTYKGVDITPGLRELQIGKLASLMSRFAAVRQSVREIQMRYYDRGTSPHMIIDGRDIGTEMFPNAEHKFYITARLEDRADRVYHVLRRRKYEVYYRDIVKSLQDRDLRDMTRLVAPLRPAHDARIIDSSFMSEYQVSEAIVMQVINTGYEPPYGYSQKFGGSLC